MELNEIKFRTIYREAKEFDEISEMCIKLSKEDKNGMVSYMQPAIVNGVFAIELYLKTLLQYEGKPIKKVHNLFELYNLLDKPFKEKLNDKNILYFLEKEKGSFEKWRYIHESGGFISVVHMQKAKQALRDICEDVYKNYNYLN